jgi:hypothetical protein
VRAKLGTFRRRDRRRALPLIAATALAIRLLLGRHWAKAGWRDWHHNYAKGHDYGISNNC